MDLATRSYLNGPWTYLSCPEAMQPCWTKPRSCVPINLENLGQRKSYLDIYSPTPSIIPTIPRYHITESSSQTPPREARLYGELQVPT